MKLCSIVDCSKWPNTQLDDWLLKSRHAPAHKLEQIEKRAAGMTTGSSSAKVMHAKVKSSRPARVKPSSAKRV